MENPKVNIPNELVTDCLISYDMTDIIGYGATASTDHPAFTEVRKILAKNGYISIPEYSCWNGDRVTKRFRFNDVQLEVGDKFYCAAAWKNRLNRKLK